MFFKRCLEEFSETSDEIIKKNVARKILRQYRGMASFSDVVLHKNGVPLKEENDEFNAARKRLYDISVELL
ncbi:hypothetical protein KAR34_02685 [bacterium]|nr:hypothetical protein [bacterium]